MLSFSPDVAKGFISNPWTIFELVAIVIIVVAWFLNQTDVRDWNGLIALASGLLWLRVFVSYAILCALSFHA